jgi:hypothetical protein
MPIAHETPDTVTTSEPSGRGIQGVSAPLVDWTIVTDAHVCVEGGEGRSQFVVLTSIRPQACKLAEAWSTSALPSAAWRPTCAFYGWKLRRVWILVETAALAETERGSVAELGSGGSRADSASPSSARKLPPITVRRILSLKPSLPGHTAIDTFAFLAGEAPGAEAVDVWYSSTEAASLVAAVRSEKAAETATASAYASHGYHQAQPTAADQGYYGESGAGATSDQGYYGESGAGATAGQGHYGESAAAVPVVSTPRMLVTGSSSGVSKQGWSPAFRVYGFSTPLPGTQRMLISRKRLRAAAGDTPAASGRNRTVGAEFTVSRNPLGADWRTVSSVFVMP